MAREEQHITAHPPVMPVNGEPVQPPHERTPGRCIICDRPAAEDARILHTGVCTECAGREEINLP